MCPYPKGYRPKRGKGTKNGQAPLAGLIGCWGKVRQRHKGKNTDKPPFYKSLKNSKQVVKINHFLFYRYHYSNY